MLLWANRAKPIDLIKAYNKHAMNARKYRPLTVTFSLGGS